MRRPLLVAPLTVALAALVLAAMPLACGGAEPQEAFDTPGASTGTSGSNGSSGSGSSGTSGTSGTSGSGGGDASTSETSTDCANEVEPNDGEDQANTLASSRCGAIQPNSESDFLTFQLSPKSTSMALEFDGKVTLKVVVNGNSVTLGGGKFPTVPFVKGKRYFIEIKAIERGTSIPWRVDLIEK